MRKYLALGLVVCTMASATLAQDKKSVSRQKAPTDIPKGIALRVDGKTTAFAMMGGQPRISAHKVTYKEGLCTLDFPPGRLSYAATDVVRQGNQIDLKGNASIMWEESTSGVSPREIKAISAEHIIVNLEP